MSGNEGADVNPDRVELAMTNHLDQITATAPVEKVNGVRSNVSELGRRDSSESVEQKPKQSTFKITSVTLHTQKGSSQDGRHSFGEEDDESAVEDSLVQTDVEDSPSPLSNISTVVKTQPVPPRTEQRQEKVDSGSRFKVVKIQKREPYTVGRWKVSDYTSAHSDLAHSTKINTDLNNHKKPSSESGNSSRASSSHYVHGVDDPSKNPLAGVANTTSVGSALSNQPQVSIQPHPPHHMTGGGYNHMTAQDVTSAHVDRNTPTVNTNSHLNTYNSTNDKHDMTAGDKIVTADGHSTIVNVGNAANQLANAAAVVNRVAPTAVQQSVTLAAHVPQHVANVDPATTTPLNTQTSVPHAVNTVPGVAPLSAANPDSQSLIKDKLKAADNVGVKPAATSASTPSGIVKERQDAENIPETQEPFGGVKDLAANLTELVDPAAAASITGSDGEQADAEAILSPKEKTSMSYRARSVDSGIGDADSSHAFFLGLDSVLNSPTSPSHSESAAATGVAIDNKIEQAMDLVKSHLMLAVREEVEDLKLQITKLLERNNLLEQENKLLKMSATPETIAQLSILSRQQNH